MQTNANKKEMNAKLRMHLQGGMLLWVEEISIE
jgi:hypothetical protein